MKLSTLNFCLLCWLVVICCPVSVSAQQSSEPAGSGQTAVQADTAAQDTIATPVPAVQDSLQDTVATDTLSGASQEEGIPSDLQRLTRLISFRKILLVLIVFVITYLLNKFMARILDNLSERFSYYRLGIKRLVPVFRITVWSIAIYIMIGGIINPPFETVITVLASVAIAVGFASQDILKNIFGGFMIIMDRPFQVGDKIEVSSYYGEVLQIGLRSTRIVTPDDSVVTIPNSELMNKAVSNANSGALDCQVVAEIFLPANVDLEQVKEIANRAASSSQYTYLRKPVTVITLNEVSDRGLLVKLRVKAYVLDIRYEFQFKSDMTDTILRELNRRKMIPEQFKP